VNKGHRGRGGYSAIATIGIVAGVVAAVNAQAIAIASIHGYRHALSPAAARIGLRCRFTPSCSRYAETVIARDGVVRGGVKALARIARCGPWTPAGTRDEP